MAYPIKMEIHSDIHIFYCPASEQVPARFVTNSFFTERILRSRRGPTRRAIVHRTIAFSFSNLLELYLQNKNDLSKQVVFCLSLRNTLDAAFFYSCYLKNFEKSCNFRSQVSTSSTIDFYLYSLPEYSQLAHCTFYRQRLRQSTLHCKVL